MKMPSPESLGSGAPPVGEAARAPAGSVGWPAPEVARHGQRASASGQPGYAAMAADLALIALFAIALRGPTLSISAFDADESYLILAARAVLSGHLPYEVFWDHKPLGSTMIVAAAMAALGHSIEAV